MLTQLLDAESVSNVFILKPGKTVDYSATTTDLDEATLSLQQSANGLVWTQAYDVDGAAVADVVGSGGSESASAVLKNDGVGPLYFRASLVETGTLAGEITITVTDRSDIVFLLVDPVTGEKLITYSDEGVQLHVPLTDDAGDPVTASSNLGVEAGVGITGGVGTTYATSVVREGGLIRTTIFIDLAGLNGGNAANDIIGTDGAGVAHLGQITDAVNGAIIAGKVTCLEVPTTSDPDVDLWSANEATGVEDTLITALTGEVQLTNGGDHTLARTIALIAFPVSGQYLYLTGGDTTAGTYDAGKFVIELIGIPTA